MNLSKSTWKDVPDDFYTFLSLKIKEYLEFELLNDNNLEDFKKESYIRISNIDLKKKIIEI